MESLRVARSSTPGHELSCMASDGHASDSALSTEFENSVAAFLLSLWLEGIEKIICIERRFRQRRKYAIEELDRLKAAYDQNWDSLTIIFSMNEQCGAMSEKTQQ